MSVTTNEKGLKPSLLMHDKTRYTGMLQSKLKGLSSSHPVITFEFFNSNLSVEVYLSGDPNDLEG